MRSSIVSMKELPLPKSGIKLTKSRTLIESIPMDWDGSKIRDLRLRMGWSSSDLARRLQMDSQKVQQIEAGLDLIESEVIDSLDLIFKQAEASANERSCDSLAEIVFVEDEVSQIDNRSIQNKFLDQ
jgi:transcriptional regulator with XRE-family HTH domain